MKLEQQVISLDIAKRLKELGVKQESLFYWLTYRQFKDEDFNLSFGNDIGLLSDFSISAFTVAELGEMLPYQIEGNWLWIQKRVPIQGGWSIAYSKGVLTKQLSYESDDTEADARGKMLIYLIENNLLPTLT